MVSCIFPYLFADLTLVLILNDFSAIPFPISLSLNAISEMGKIFVDVAFIVLIFLLFELLLSIRLLDDDLLLVPL